jgi:hypothetical protein
MDELTVSIGDVSATAYRARPAFPGGRRIISIRCRNDLKPETMDALMNLATTAFRNLDDDNPAASFKDDDK